MPPRDLPTAEELDALTARAPYASELFGVYQPLLGWRARLTKKWLSKTGSPVDRRLRRLIDQRYRPGPQVVVGAANSALATEPLELATERPRFRVVASKDLGSQVVEAVRAAAETFANQRGALPRGEEWLDLLAEAELLTHLRVSVGTHSDAMVTPYRGQTVTPSTEVTVKAAFLDAVQFESQAARFLRDLALKDPDRLNKIFALVPVPTLAQLAAALLQADDPLAQIDPKDTNGVLSPLGVIHLYRQYFFDLGTFVGEPVEHVWLAPGSSLELVEIHTRKRMVERTTELALEAVFKSETSSTTEDELSDAVKQDNQLNTTLGVATSHSGGFMHFYQGSASANFGVNTTSSQGRQQTHRHTTQQTQRLSTEIKRSYKTMVRTVTETTDMTSRRYVIQNPSPNEIVNYELRRKMRRIGVQVQDIGQRLCWQVFVDDPGKELGVAQLVHVAKPAEDANVAAPQVIPYPSPIQQAMQINLPFQRHQGDNDTGNMYVEDSNWSETGHIHLGDVNDKIKVNYLGFHAPPPAGFELLDVRPKSVVGNHFFDPLFKISNKATGHFDLHLRGVFFPVEGRLTAEVELVFAATKDLRDKVDADNKKAELAADAEKADKLRQSYFDAVRERIKFASQVDRRPSWDLREEERTVVYRQLIRALMLDSWEELDKNAAKADLAAKLEEARRIAHVRSEMIRAIFDVDEMLYFVAPEWWAPRIHRSAQDFEQSTTGHTLTSGETVGWGGIREAGRDNYRITEESDPAPLGASLGWLLQLDGDNLRNAFLNSPWVKAVVPIRPGREMAALNWLRALEKDDGLEAPYVGAEPEFAGMTLGEVLEDVAAQVQAQNGDFTNVLQADKVFESGFDPLEKAFDAAAPAGSVFSQWISILPTDQIVAMIYDPVVDP